MSRIQECKSPHLLRTQSMQHADPHYDALLRLFCTIGKLRLLLHISHHHHLSRKSPLQDIREAYRLRLSKTADPIVNQSEIDDVRTSEEHVKSLVPFAMDIYDNRY